MRAADFPFLPKDFIQTAEGLIFAVVGYQPCDGKVGCFLRYVPAGTGWQKVNTQQAFQLLQQQFPHYLYHCTQFDTVFHAVSPEEIVCHYRPEVQLQTLLSHTPQDVIVGRLQRLLALFSHLGMSSQTLGITGSLLIGQQRRDSDIDLVVYGRQSFQQIRKIMATALQTGQISALDQSLMAAHYRRRNAALDFAEFAWHEQRKLNKAVIEGTKFDIGLVGLAEEVEADSDRYQKQGQRTFVTRVLDDTRAFDFPARYRVDDAVTPEIISFTHTYVGQARKNEWIEVVGMVEQNQRTGQCRLIVGASREAAGEYIRVVAEK